MSTAEAKTATFPIQDYQPAQLARPVTPMEMLATAIDRGMAVETVDKLMGLADRWDKTQARKAFDHAIAAAKAKIPVISKNATGHNSKKYADFASIARAIDPILGEFGLSYRFRTVQDDKLIRVTCVLSHEAGHFEETTLAGPADASGSKNAIQAIGSTLTYLQRYSLTQALGLAAAEDDDGKAAASGELIDAQQVEWLQTLIVQVGADLPRFLKYLKVSAIEDIKASQYPVAVDLLNKKKNDEAKKAKGPQE